MSNYLIVRIENYKMASAIKVDIEKDHNEKYNNPDCDKSKTHENIVLEHDAFKDGKTLPKYIMDYREQNNIQGRMTTSGKEKSQTNVLTQCIITTSKEYMESLNKNEQIDFFKDGLKAFKEMYPSYHIIDAVIHKDEQTPHMHINALPLYYNPEKDILQFSTTKTQAGKFHYRDLQNHMHEYLSRTWNVERGLSHEERSHMNKKEWQQLKDREQSLSQREEAIKQYEDRPLPHKGFLKKEKYDKEDVDRLVDERNTLYTKLEQKERENQNLESEISWERYKYRELNKNFTLEHEEHLKLTDKQLDKNYLIEQLQEIEHLQDRERESQREVTINGR